MEKNNYYAVIMAGGGGVRLWPWSTKNHPKQMLNIAGERSMFQISVERLLGVIDYERILVVTTAEQAEALRAQEPNIPNENYIIEPMPRGTASVIGLAAIHLLNRCENPIMAVLTADHFIENEEYFRELLLHAKNAALDDHLVTLGISPTYPSTGMGYIQMDEKIPSFGSHDLYKVMRFREKPDQATAQIFLDLGGYYWNSGMFFWRAERILQEMESYLPDLSAMLRELSDGIKEGTYDEKMARLWGNIVPQTIDYGVMEKAKDVAALPAHGLGWNDIGSWNALYDVLPQDENGNISINCKALHLDSKGVLARAENQEKIIVTIGLDDIVVVETEKAILICPKNETQRVRDIVAQLKTNHMDQYL